MYNITKNSTAGLVLLASVTFGATATMAATQAIINPATADPAAITAGQQQIQQADARAQSGREAMSYIVAARRLLSEQHEKEARHYLEQARDLLKKLKSEVSTEKNNATGLLPIYSQLGIKKEVEITDQLRQKLEKVHLDIVRGKHKKVVEALKTTEIELQYSFVDLPVATTLGKVESALKSLAAKNTSQAGESLADAEAELIHDSIVINAVSENPA